MRRQNSVGSVVTCSSLFTATDPTPSALYPCRRLAGYPWSISDVAQDGVLVHFSSLPDQGYTGYNLGMTAVHETGVKRF